MAPSGSVFALAQSVVVAAVVHSILLSGAPLVEGRTQYILNLDAWTWDKLIPLPPQFVDPNATSKPGRQLFTYYSKPTVVKRPHITTYIVRFDKEFPHGPAHEAFTSFAQHIANATPAVPIVVGDVRLKDMGESKNIPLLRRFGMKDSDVPQIAILYGEFEDGVSDAMRPVAFPYDSTKTPFVSTTTTEAGDDSQQLRYPTAWFLDSERNRTTDALCRWVIQRTGHWLPTLRGTSPEWRQWAHDLFSAASPSTALSLDELNATLTQRLKALPKVGVSEGVAASPLIKPSKASYERLGARLVSWVLSRYAGSASPPSATSAVAAEHAHSWYRHELRVLSDLFYRGVGLTSKRRATVDREWNVLMSFVA